MGYARTEGPASGVSWSREAGRVHEHVQDLDYTLAFRDEVYAILTWTPRNASSSPRREIVYNPPPFKTDTRSSFAGALRAKASGDTEIHRAYPQRKPHTQHGKSKSSNTDM